MQQDENQSYLIQISRDVKSSRNSLLSTVNVLIGRGEKLERIAQLGEDLSAFSGELHRRTEQSKKPRPQIFLIAFFVFLAALSGLLVFFYWSDIERLDENSPTTTRTKK